MAALLPKICRDHNRSSGHFDRGSIGIMDFMPKDLLVVPMEIFLVLGSRILSDPDLRFG